MNREEVIRLAHKSGLLDEHHHGSRWTDRVLEFAELVAAAERDFLAKQAEQQGQA